VLDQRKGEIERRADPDLTFEPHFAAVRLHDALSNGQPQAGADCIASSIGDAVELVEDVALVFGLDALAGVADADRDERGVAA